MLEKEVVEKIEKLKIEINSPPHDEELLFYRKLNLHKKKKELLKLEEDLEERIEARNRVTTREVEQQILRTKEKIKRKRINSYCTALGYHWLKLELANLEEMFELKRQRGKI